MTRQLVISVSLEDISTTLEKFSHDIDVTPVCGEMQGSPLMDSTGHIHIEVFFIT